MKIIFTIVLLTFAFSFSTWSQSLYQIPENVERSSISTFENPNGAVNNGGKTNKSAKGNAFESLKAGESKTLLELKGAGVIQRMWFTLQDRSPEMLRALRLQMFWDNSSKPAVDVPFGDFFGFGLAKAVKFETALFSNPEGRSFNSVVPMPFKTGAKVVITNESAKDIDLLFYDIDFIKLKKAEENALYFHAFWTRQKTSELGKDFEFLPKIEGKGRYLGANFGVNADKKYGDTWWGEGEVKIFMDDDAEFPSFNGTGAEDYIGTAWGLGVYTNMFQGCTIADETAKQYAFYRFHIPDQIFFFKNFRAVIQQIGGGMRENVRALVKQKVPLTPVSVNYGSSFRRLLDDPKDIFDEDFPDGWINFYRVDDYSATAYFYLDKPSSTLPKLAGVKDRLN